MLIGYNRFGYLGSAADGAAALLTGKGVAAALKQFQRFVFCLRLTFLIIENSKPTLTLQYRGTWDSICNFVTVL